MGASKPLFLAPDGAYIPSSTKNGGPFNGVFVGLDNTNNRAVIKDVAGNFPIIEVPIILADKIYLDADGNYQVFSDGTGMIFRCNGKNLMKLKNDGDLVIRGNYNSGGNNW